MEEAEVGDGGGKLPFWCWCWWWGLGRKGDGGLGPKEVGN